MKTRWKLIILFVIFLLGVLSADLLYDKISGQQKNKDQLKVLRKQQHIEDMKDGADPQLGEDKIPEDYIVKDDFESHLPLVILDIGDKEIPITKTYVMNTGSNSEDVKIIKSGENPYVKGKMQIIDHKDHDNTLSDEPTQESEIKIKYRGNSSINYKKKQFGIQLINRDESNHKMSLMSMEENNDWILNISMIDNSLIRNYMAYNLGSSMFPYTPEAKYCEVVFRTKGTYEYQGLYLMMEKIEKGDGRVEISKYTPGDKTTSYLLCRDREDTSERQLSTYCSINKLCYGRLSVLYPDKKCMDDHAFEYIQSDIDKIERVLYSDNDTVYNEWPNYLDTQSFVDYFLFNEYMGNYDAGNNSTYYYKDKYGKLFVGPVWDYDGAMDNYSIELNEPESVVFQNQPWFKRLCRSKYYVQSLQERYKDMSETLFSYKEMEQYIDSVSLFLGNAAKRDWSRWESVYGENNYMQKEIDNCGFTVDRKRETYDEELLRLKDYFYMKDKAMGGELKKLNSNTIDNSVHIGILCTALLVIAIFSAVVLIRRKDTFR